jgi:fluoride exporter
LQRHGEFALETPCLFVCGTHFFSQYLDGDLAHSYNHYDKSIGDEARQRDNRYCRKTNSFYHNRGRGFFVERNPVDKILIVGVGGFIGANVRYWLGAWIDAQFGLRFPLGTFVINLTGSLLLGFIATITLERALIDPRWRLAVAVGFIGAYTTFSTFTYESVKLLEAGSYGLAALNIVSSTVLGLVGATIGIALGRAI